jgi:predicted RNase H-like nuclease (RuvC/YqgF family)
MRKHPPRLIPVVVTGEAGIAVSWKELARQNGIAFRDAHDQLSRAESQLADVTAKLEAAEGRVGELEAEIRSLR